jgi:hypothetical protein
LRGRPQTILISGTSQNFIATMNSKRLRFLPSIKSLKQLVHFYNTRDVYPFKVTSGHCPEEKTEKVDCWPMPEVPNNVDMTLGNLGLTDQEEDQIVTFLQTLTDGFTTRIRTSTPLPVNA